MVGESSVLLLVQIRDPQDHKFWYFFRRKGSLISMVVQS